MWEAIAGIFAGIAVMGAGLIYRSESKNIILKNRLKAAEYIIRACQEWEYYQKILNLSPCKWNKNGNGD